MANRLEGPRADLRSHKMGRCLGGEQLKIRYDRNSVALLLGVPREVNRRRPAPWAASRWI